MAWQVDILKEKENSTIMDHSTIVKWAAGSIKEFPDSPEFDKDVLIDLLSLHNLSGRFMIKLTDPKAPPFTSQLKKAIRDLHEETKQHVKRNLNAFRSIMGRLPSSTDIIIIKGVSTYVLTGQEHTMRAGDIDLLSNNTTSLVHTLCEMDYRQTRAPFLHEVGEYTKGSIEVDIHDHFPVYGYAGSLQRADLLPRKHPGIWHQSHTMKHCKITYFDLKKYVYRGNGPDTLKVTVADPNIMAVIICAHAFMNYTNMWSISHREKVYVRLGEIADLFDLAHHSTFNRQYFLELVKRFEAADAVEWAADISSVLFGMNPLPVRNSAAFDRKLPGARFPRCLWWNFWADLPVDVDVLVQKQWLSMDWLIKELGFNTLTANQGASRTYSTIPYEGCQPLTRLITQEKQPIPLTLEISAKEKGISITVKILPGVQPGDIIRIRIDFGHIATEWTYSINEHIQTSSGDPVDVTINIRDTNREINLEYSWEMVGPSIKKERKAPVLIGVGLQCHNDGLIDSTLIPLVLCFNH